MTTSRSFFRSFLSILLCLGFCTAAQAADAGKNKAQTQKKT